MSAVGVAVAVLVDIVVPVGIIVFLSRGSHERRASARSERFFWGWVAVYALLMAVFVVPAIAAVPRYDGFPVIFAVLFTLPLSAIPAIVNSSVMNVLFSDLEWAAFGYLTVLPVFLVGVIAWALVLPVTVRTLVGVERVNREARMAALQQGDGAP